MLRRVTRPDPSVVSVDSLGIFDPSVIAVQKLFIAGIERSVL